jgi:hypothetical protein
MNIHNGLCGLIVFAMLIIYPIISHSDSLSITENFVPITPKGDTQLYIVSHPQRVEYFPVVLIQDQGYEIDCKNSQQLLKVISGFGFSPEVLSFTPKVQYDDPLIVDSNYRNNPKLRCNSQIVYKNQDNDYFIKLTQQIAKEVAWFKLGCQGLIDALKDETKPIEHLQPGVEFSNRQLDCKSGIEPGFPDSRENWISEIVAGYINTCVIKANKRMQCWGNNAKTQLELFYQEHPDFLASHVALAEEFTCTAGMEKNKLKELKEQKIYCWGEVPDNFKTFDVKNKFLRVKLLSAGATNVCAILENTQGGSNEIQCVGKYYIPSEKIEQQPKVTGKITALSLGPRHSCIIDQDGTKCWGDKESNLKVCNGDGVKCPNLTRLSSGADYNCALTDEDNVWCWGKTYKIDKLSKIKYAKSISSKIKTTCVLTQFDTVKCNNITNEVPPIHKAKKIAVGAAHICIIKPNGAVQCWGDNRRNQSAVPEALSW